MKKHADSECPDAWPLETGAKIAWPSDTVEAQGSDGVADYIAAKNPYSIGYIDAGHGHKLGLSEIHLKNKAGTSLTSKRQRSG
eukprot:gene5921-8662_t